ncbi:MAG TPA: glutamine-hydrolyzing GMP synthase subunit GuaA, partial [Methanothrix sp.]|nr:glutamine-hydrolyzing GMP synthase subunit GuaA [Methanothrix sp.]
MAMNVQSFIENAIEEIRREVKGRAIIGLSGGVDSSACAMLAYRAIGDRLVPVYVDSGLMRQFESDRIEELFRGIGLVRVNAEDRFLEALRGVTDPEEKRMVVGETFIRVFEEEARKIGGDCLMQG